MMQITFYASEWGYGNMPQGLQIFDVNSNCLLDITDRLTRVLGSFETGTSDGSITDFNLTSGTPWFYTYNPSDTYNVRVPCKISFSGNIISWSFQSGYCANQQGRANLKVIYGVY